LVALSHEIRHDEALHHQAFHHDQTRHAARAVRRWYAVILRDRATAGDAAVIVHLWQARFQNVAADIVEIDVDSLGRRGAQRLEHRAILVVDRGVEAEFGCQPAAFVLAAGNADHATTLDPGDLSDEGADGACGGRDHDGLSA